MSTELQKEIGWMILSPYWLAKITYDNYRIQNNKLPELNTIGQGLLDDYNLGLPPRILIVWMNEFKYIN